jgi:hypothetical protein
MATYRMLEQFYGDETLYTEEAFVLVKRLQEWKMLKMTISRIGTNVEKVAQIMINSCQLTWSENELNMSQETD